MFSRHLLVVLQFLIPISGFAGNSGKTDLKKEKSSAAFQHFKYLDAPGYKLYFENNGNIQDPSGNWSMEFPKNSGKYSLFAGGFALSGYVDGELRASWMASASRVEDWQPGNIVNGSPADPTDPKFRVYGVSMGDFPGKNPDVPEWPVDLGAEFNDLNNNGIYEPDQGELPKIFGSQMLWYVINDGITESDPNRRFKTKGMGLEAQVSAFFFAGQNAAMDNTAFIIYKFINKGAKPVNNMIFSLWSDPDLGNSDDDLVGVDSVRSLAYCYNESNTDTRYGVGVPAFGYDFFLGPKVFTGNNLDTVDILGKKYPGYKSLGMKSFVKYVRDRSDLPDPNSAAEARNYQEGKKFNGVLFNPLTDGVGGTAANNPLIVHPGFPETPSGWIDITGADRRMMINTQPFSMEPGDTQVIIVGYVIGFSGTNLTSISDLREKSDISQKGYSNLVNLKPEKPKLGTLNLTVLDLQNNPIEHASVSITPFGFSKNPKFFHNSLLGPYTSLLYEGYYHLEVIGNDEVWGWNPDTIKTDFSITEDNISNQTITVNRIPGYEDDFSGKFSNYWIAGENGDTAFTTNPVTTWRTINGYLGWPGTVQYKGRYTVKATLELKDFINPTLEFKPMYSLSTTDTLLVYASGDNGFNWTKLDSYQAEFSGAHLKKSYSLNSFISITDSVKVKFRVVKNSITTLLTKIDDFKISHSGYTSVGEDLKGKTDFSLLPAYPNPFNPSTTIRWIQPAGGEATIRVMNLLGQEVKVFSAGNRVSGQNEQTLSFNGLASGLYFYRIDLNGKSSPTGKLMLLK
ncbi:MAG: T9SS type A sorting domain-containing protein [Bacteroidetes bacterium]|nr:T9SS type A sorting domain-containing protein [Bacteroidota bacterium]